MDGGEVARGGKREKRKSKSGKAETGFNAKAQRLQWMARRMMPGAGKGDARSGDPAYTHWELVSGLAWGFNFP